MRVSCMHSGSSVKSPKIYWSDTGLAMHLGAETAPRGAHLENLVLTDLLAWAGIAPRQPNLLHWRTAAGAEVDFVIELAENVDILQLVADVVQGLAKLLRMEVKASRRITPRDARHLRTFLADYPAAPGALLLYDGNEVFWMEERVLACPWHRVI